MRALLASIAGAVAVALLASSLLPSRADSAFGCGQVVTAGIVRAEGCFTKTGNTVWESTQTVDLNGIQLRPPPSSKLVIDTQSRRVVSMSRSGVPTFIFVSVRGIPNESSPKVFRFDKLDFVAPTGTGDTEDEMVLGYANLTPPVLAGLNPLGTVDVPITLTEEQDDGSVGEIAFTYRLPGALSLLDKQGAVSVVAELFPATGAVFDGVEIEASGLTVGDPPTLGVEELAFRYRQSQQLFEGKLQIVFPRPTNPTKGAGVGGEARVEAGKLKRIGLKGSQLGIEIFPQIKLASIFAAVEPSPIKVEGGVAFDAGEELPKSVPVIGGNPPLRGEVALTVQAPRFDDPKRMGIGQVGLRGKVDLFTLIPLGEAGFTVYYTSPTVTPPQGRISSINFDARAGIGLPRFTNSAQGNALYMGGYISGWWQGKNYDPVKQRYLATDYNFEGSVRTSILGWDVSGGQAVISTEGIAACVKPIWWSPYVGGGYSYRRGFSLLGGWRDCGLGAYRNTSRAVNPRELRWASTAQRAARGGGATELLELDRDEQMIKIEGDGQVPSFTMESREGERISYRWSGESPVFGPEKRWVVLGDPQSDTAYVLMRDPEGRWAVSELPGAGANARAGGITSIEQAATQEPPIVEARVAGRGFHRTLRWRTEGLRRNDEIQFFETIGGGGRNPIVETGARRGSEQFTPAFGPRKRHSLHAIVTRRGTPFEDERLGRFTVRPPRAPATPRRLRVERFGTEVTARWKRIEGAHGYVAVLESADGGISVPHKVGRRASSFTFEDAAVQPKMRVKLYALGRLGFPSDPAVRRFPAIPPERTLGRSVRSMLRSAEVLRGGNLGFIAPCPGHGQCHAKLTVSKRGKRLGSARARVIPESRKRMHVRLPSRLRKRLASGGAERVLLAGSIKQAGDEAAKRRNLRVER